MTGKTTYLLRICFLDDQTLNKINRTCALFTQFQYIPMEAVKSSVYVVVWMLTSCKHKAVSLPAVKCLPSPTRIHLYLEPSLHWSMPSAILCCCAPFSISISYPPPHPTPRVPGTRVRPFLCDRKLTANTRKPLAGGGG